MDEELVNMMCGCVPERVRYAMQCFGIPETAALFMCIAKHQPVSNVKLIEIFKTDQAYLWEVIKPLGETGLIEQSQWEGVILYRVTRFGESLFNALFDAVIPDSHRWEPVKP
jgi:hypothetical protein